MINITEYKPEVPKATYTIELNADEAQALVNLCWVSDFITGPEDKVAYAIANRFEKFGVKRNKVASVGRVEFEGF